MPTCVHTHTSTSSPTVNICASSSPAAMPTISMSAASSDESVVGRRSCRECGGGADDAPPLPRADKRSPLWAMLRGDPGSDADTLRESDVPAPTTSA